MEKEQTQWMVEDGNPDHQGGRTRKATALRQLRCPSWDDLISPSAAKVTVSPECQGLLRWVSLYIGRKGQ